MNEAETFDAHRAALLARAVRLLGDVERAEATLHEAWLRWQRRQVSVDAPGKYLLAMVTQICLDELRARSRREERRDRRRAMRS